MFILADATGTVPLPVSLSVLSHRVKTAATEGPFHGFQRQQGGGPKDCGRPRPMLWSDLATAAMPIWL